MDGWRPGTVSGVLTLLCGVLMLRARRLSPSPTSQPAAITPLGGYACVWAAHTLLQLHAQGFLFPAGTRLPLGLVTLALVFLPSRTTLTAAILLRNAARSAQSPFVWDSEYWLALTDAATLASMLWAEEGGRQKQQQRLPHIGAWVRRQLALLYAAAACFKLNTAFLSTNTSCAPIFGLSLLEHVPSLAQWVADTPILVQAIAHAMPWLVIGTEAFIALLLAAPSYSRARGGVWLALLFHLAIAITPPPNGVPTFSCVAASRLILCVGEDARPVATALRRIVGAARSLTPGLVGLLAAAPLVSARPPFDPAIALFVCLMGLNALALAHDAPAHDAPAAPAAAAAAAEALKASRNEPPEQKRRRRGLLVLGGAAFAYGFGLPVLGLQEIGSCTMFANMRLVQGGSNHALGLPTGLLQVWHAATSPAAHPYAGGVVRIESTSSDFLNALYPGEITSLLAGRTRSMLRSVGHATRQFNPKARRVLGEGIRARMPRWDPRSGAPFVRYTVPALELRRMLIEARRAAAAGGTSFDVHYTRLAGGHGDEHWRAHARGVAVRLTGDDGRGNFRCVARDETGTETRWWPGGGWTDCDSDELALLPEPSKWALKLSLYYPYAIVPEASEGPVCNY